MVQQHDLITTEIHYRAAHTTFKLVRQGEEGWRAYIPNHLPGWHMCDDGRRFKIEQNENVGYLESVNAPIAIWVRNISPVLSTVDAAIAWALQQINKLDKLFKANLRYNEQDIPF